MQISPPTTPAWCMENIKECLQAEDARSVHLYSRAHCVALAVLAFSYASYQLVVVVVKLPFAAVKIFIGAIPTGNGCVGDFLPDVGENMVMVACLVACCVCASFGAIVHPKISQKANDGLFVLSEESPSDEENPQVDGDNSEVPPEKPSTELTSPSPSPQEEVPSNSDTSAAVAGSAAPNSTPATRKPTTHSNPSAPQAPPPPSAVPSPSKNRDNTSSSNRLALLKGIQNFNSNSLKNLKTSGSSLKGGGQGSGLTPTGGSGSNYMGELKTALRKGGVLSSNKNRRRPPEGPKPPEQQNELAAKLARIRKKNGEN